ncbi:hypothetical protein C8R43DRAFT_1143741 [Mycena crocata]|nr:hypothetical protein C8R43DRAFT_1143741 [Mycena crocata]
MYSFSSCSTFNSPPLSLPLPLLRSSSSSRFTHTNQAIESNMHNIAAAVGASSFLSQPNPIPRSSSHTCNIADIADTPLHVIGFKQSQCRSKDTFLNNIRGPVHGQRRVALPRKFYSIFGSPADKVTCPSTSRAHQPCAHRQHTAPLQT